MILEFTLKGPIPAKKNSRRNFRGLSLPSENYLKWHKENLPTAKTAAGVSSLDVNKPLKIEVLVTFKDKRRRDLDNELSSVLDLMVDAGVIKDDCWVNVPEMSIKGVKGEEDKAVIKVTQIGV